MLTFILGNVVYATENEHRCQGNDNCDDVNIDFDGGDSNADSSSDSTSSSGAESASSSGATSDNNVAVTFTRPSSTTVRNVASPDTPNVYPSAPCRIARSAGLSLAGGALSGGSSIEDPECTLRETARVFQYLGVPEVGLYLMCQQSAVINGRYDKHGEIEEGTPTPIGSEECLRLVREFQGDVDDDNTEGALSTQIEVLREQQDILERRFVARAAELEREHEKTQQVAASRPAARVTQEIIQQPYLNDEKRAKLSALIGDNNEETSE